MSGQGLCQTLPHGSYQASGDLTSTLFKDSMARLFNNLRIPVFMDAENPRTRVRIKGPKTCTEIKKNPAILPLFAKMIYLAMVRPNQLKSDRVLARAQIIFKNIKPDIKLIREYKRVCKFESTDQAASFPETIPASYLQTLFIGPLSRYIGSKHFPINPMGLIHIGQSFELKRPLATDETLDLSCRLKEMIKTEKGTESRFLLEITTNNELVWQGLSTFLTRTKAKPGKKKKRKKQETFLAQQEIIQVAGNTGRQYARVSRDYNPHHLFGFTARIFGFKQPIAHGMWSLARVTANLEKKIGVQYPLKVEGMFKLPVFMPASLVLEYEKTDNGILFELRDKKKGLPHLKGSFNHRG